MDYKYHEILDLFYEGIATIWPYLQKKIKKKSSKVLPL
jgi:hypothetical protein